MGQQRVSNIALIDIKSLEGAYANDSVVNDDIDRTLKIEKICFSPKVSIQPFWPNLIQPFLEPFQRHLGQKSYIKRRGEVEWLRALDLKSGGSWFKSSTLPLSGFVLGSPEFNSSTALCK